MRRSEREAKEALTRFKRSAAQIKRYQPEIDTDEILGEARTARQIDMALERMRIIAEQKYIKRDLVRMEAKREEYLKRQSEKKIRNQHRKAYRTLKKNRPGLGWDRADYDMFWDTFGSSDIIDYFGSEQMIETGNRLLYMAKEEAQDLITPEEIGEMTKLIAQNLEGSGFTREEAVDYLTDYIKAEIAWRRKEHDDTVRGSDEE